MKERERQGERFRGVGGRGEDNVIKTKTEVTNLKRKRKTITKRNRKSKYKSNYSQNIKLK
jgi:hypothetical protein